jgi:F-type H+-transporting ATPase subunit a
VIIGAVEFPPIENVVEWPAFFGDGTFFAFNKIALINVLAVIITAGIFFMAGQRKALVPRGVQNLAEVSVDFVRNQIIAPGIGHGGERYLPMLVAIFFFVFFGNITEVIPPFNMPANARMANPLILALLAWLWFIGVGIKHHGFSYIVGALFPPGVPKALYLLVTPIEFVSTFLVRPFSLAVRLFANMLAGHILLITFAVLCITLWGLQPLVAALPLSLFMLIALTGFEVLVAFLQAYIFTILTAVYIGGALHPEH